LRHILIYSPRMSEYGGIETHLLTIATTLSSSGWHVELLTTSGALSRTLKTPAAVAGVTFHELRATGANRLFRVVWLVWNILRLRRTRWDVIYTNAQGCLARVVWLAARRGCRIVHHHHTSADRDERRSWTRCFRRVLETAPELIACSHATRREIRQEVGDRAVDVLYYLTAPIPALLPMPVRTSREPLRFGYVGRLIPEKGIDIILGLSRDPDLAGIEWHIHGEGARYPADTFQSYDRVRYHGPYTGTDALVAALSGLDALVLFSSHSEGLPLALIEGMAAGLPWIATNRGGTAELCYEPANCRLLHTGCDSTEIKQAVLDMAAAIVSGRTSRRTQRDAYDRHLSPACLAAKWSDFFASGQGTRAHGE
jgi:glycosyltransferase involved in cell wall biosynthesis